MLIAANRVTIKRQSRLGRGRLTAANPSEIGRQAK
jgi:hypothetical protein